MTRETRKLLAQRHLGISSLGEFVDWAVFLLEADLDTPHLRMLASLGSAPNRADIAYYFGQTLDELGWQYPEPEALLRQYVQDIAREIVEGAITPIDGCRQIYQANVGLNYPTDLYAWSYLDDQMEEGTYQTLEGADWEAAIRREAQKLLTVN